MAWASGIPVLKSMKACGTGNTLITVDDAHQLRKVNLTVTDSPPS